MSNVAAGPGLLESYTWQQRLLLIFAPGKDDPRMQRQDAILDALKPELDDRDLAVIRLTPDAGVSVDRVPAAAASAADIYRDFGISRDAFAVLLIGKDGGAKLTRAAPVDAGTIFDLIDAMPMRQWEMQNQGAFTNQD